MNLIAAMTQKNQGKVGQSHKASDSDSGGLNVVPVTEIWLWLVSYFVRNACGRSVNIKASTAVSPYKNL